MHLGLATKLGTFKDGNQITVQLTYQFTLNSFVPYFGTWERFTETSERDTELDVSRVAAIMVFFNAAGAVKYSSLYKQVFYLPDVCAV